MTKLVKRIISLVIICLLVFGIYKIFFDCEKSYTNFDNTITLKKMDYSIVSDEAIVKLIGISDNRCKEENCEREGEMVAKLLVVNNHRISYVKLGTLANNSQRLEKLNYNIELLSIENDEVKIKLTKLD